ncbi:uncharacterized protein LOC142564939 isoform X2 [Dermacentor variabilis]|uniref:uncharacterized protein LOC142564939 isoform X2 n=1 Tax=Dermacentor variabilis TaxID=34621 RepID=UPI003F5B9665
MSEYNDSVAFKQTLLLPTSTQVKPLPEIIYQRVLQRYGRMYAKVLLILIIILFVVCFVNPGSSCNTRLPPLGPRLLRAKSLFGDFMRTCNKELVEMANIIRSTRFRKVVQISCRMYNTCKESTWEKIPIQDMTQAEFVEPSSEFYTDLKMPEEFRLGAANYMTCMHKMGMTLSVLPETMDDALAYGHKAIFAFGWV